MKVLVIGSGAREHAIAWKLSQSKRKPKLYVAPGNPGISEIATCAPIEASDLKGLLKFALSEKIDLTIVGPEAPLVMGIVDLFEANGLKIFGPNQEAAQFEGSKCFTKDFLMKNKIPTAAYKVCETVEIAMDALSDFEYPVVIKADGLAAGKGVVIAENRQDAQRALKAIMEDKQFGNAGERVVLEAFLKGVEASVLCFCDGETILPMQVAQDYKKAFDGDLGLNTGGMGAYCPSRIVDTDRMDKIKESVLIPFLKGLKDSKVSYKGILFVGLMIDEDEVNVLEFNVRFGDPETEVILPRLETDLLDVFEAVVEEKLSEVDLVYNETHTVGVILASGGYPEFYEKGIPIYGLEKCKNSLIFHAGTSWLGDDYVTSGGRVLCLVGQGQTHEIARKNAYLDASRIQFNGCFYRKDIGQ